MRRREFMTILGGAAVFGPRIARAQGAMPVVGLLSGTNREPRLIDAIWKGLMKSATPSARPQTWSTASRRGISSGCPRWPPNWSVTAQR
jgi:hypothetical protein